MKARNAAQQSLQLILYATTTTATMIRNLQEVRQKITKWLPIDAWFFQIDGKDNPLATLEALRKHHTRGKTVISRCTGGTIKWRWHIEGAFGL